MVSTRVQDAIGNPIPSGTTIINRTNITNININFVNVRDTLGVEPINHFLFVPRTAFFAGFFTSSGGFLLFERHRRHSLVQIGLFFPFYFSDPYWYAFGYPGYYPSVYSLWGWCPGWVYPQRVYYDPNDFIYRPPRATRYVLDAAGVDDAISDIHDSWMDADIRDLSAHLTDNVDVRIYFNGRYSYTSSTPDFYAMTADNLATVHTLSVDFDRPIWISRAEVFVTGRQVYQDTDGDRHDLYLSYRLRKLGATWYIVAFGSSPDPIESPYSDFRYR